MTPITPQTIDHKMQQAGLGTGHRQQPTSRNSPHPGMARARALSCLLGHNTHLQWPAAPTTSLQSETLRVVPSLSEETRRSPAWSESHCEYTPASPQLSAHSDTTNIPPTTNQPHRLSTPTERLLNVLIKCPLVFPSYLLWSVIPRLDLLWASVDLFVNICYLITLNCGRITI